MALSTSFKVSNINIEIRLRRSFDHMSKAKFSLNRVRQKVDI